MGWQKFIDYIKGVIGDTKNTDNSIHDTKQFDTGGLVISDILKAGMQYAFWGFLIYTAKSGLFEFYKFNNSFNLNDITDDKIDKMRKIADATIGSIYENMFNGLIRVHRLTNE